VLFAYTTFYVFGHSTVFGSESVKHIESLGKSNLDFNESAFVRSFSCLGCAPIPLGYPGCGCIPLKVGFLSMGPNWLKEPVSQLTLVAQAGLIEWS
jgi:hypothetical protein